MMAAGAAVALALWLLLPAVGVGEAGPPPIQDGEFTFLLPAGRKQCFYQSAPANASLETEYQVRGSRVWNSGEWGVANRRVGRGMGVARMLMVLHRRGMLYSKPFGLESREGPGGCWVGYP